MRLSFLGAVLGAEKSPNYFAGPNCLLNEAMIGSGEAFD